MFIILILPCSLHLLNSSHHNHCSQGCLQPQIPKWPFLGCVTWTKQLPSLFTQSVHTRRYHLDSNSPWGPGRVNTRLFPVVWKRPYPLLSEWAVCSRHPQHHLCWFVPCCDTQALSPFTTHSTAELHPSLLLPHMQHNSPFLPLFPKSLSPSIIILLLCEESHHISVIPMRS